MPALGRGWLGAEILIGSLSGGRFSCSRRLGPSLKVVIGRLGLKSIL